MFVRKITLPEKQTLKIKQGVVSGTVTLMAKSARHRAAYSWEQSTDQKTWAVLPPTLEAKTHVVGLIPGTVYFFRVQSLRKAGLQNWSGAVSLMVV